MEAHMFYFRKKHDIKWQPPGIYVNADWHNHDATVPAVAQSVECCLMRGLTLSECLGGFLRLTGDQQSTARTLSTKKWSLDDHNSESCKVRWEFEVKNCHGISIAVQISLHPFSFSVQLWYALQATHLCWCRKLTSWTSVSLVRFDVCFILTILLLCFFDGLASWLKLEATVLFRMTIHRVHAQLFLVFPSTQQDF